MICVNDPSQWCCANLAPATLGSPQQTVQEFSIFIWRNLFFSLHRAGEPFFESTRWKQWALLQCFTMCASVYMKWQTMCCDTVLCSSNRTLSSVRTPTVRSRLQDCRRTLTQCHVVLWDRAFQLCLNGFFWLLELMDFQLLKLWSPVLSQRIPEFGCLLCHQPSKQTTCPTPAWYSDTIYDISFDFWRKMSVSEPGAGA